MEISQSEQSLTDEEVIAEFMEPRPAADSGPVVNTPNTRWWVYSFTVVGRQFHWEWHANTLDLDALREVEERLDATAQDAYDKILRKATYETRVYLWHASAEQKIKALATVLRAVKP